MTTQIDEELVDGWIIKCKCLFPEELTIKDLMELVSLARQEERVCGFGGCKLLSIGKCQKHINEEWNGILSIKEQEAFEKGKQAGREEAIKELTKRKIGGSVSKPIIGSPIPDTDKMLKRIAELEKQVAGHQLSDTQATGVAILVREKLALEKELEHAVFCYDKKCKRCKANRILRIGKGD